MRRLVSWGLALGAMYLFAGANVVSAAAAALCPVTMQNLQSAFNGESNAHNRYLAFAEKADQEGYAGAASYFRAAARAEQIHATKHASVLESFGVKPAAITTEPAVLSTEENLQVALKGEIYERDEMYPSFIEQAKQAGESAAVTTFTFAKEAETQHAILYGNAINKLDDMRQGLTLYVCPVCGFTATQIDFKKCPTCATPKENYEKVS